MQLLFCNFDTTGGKATDKSATLGIHTAFQCTVVTGWFLPPWRPSPLFPSPTPSDAYATATDSAQKLHWNVILSSFANKT